MIDSDDTITLNDVPPPTERRQHPRYATEQRCWIKFGSEKKQKWLKLKTKNLSRFGCCVPMSGLPQQMRMKTKTQFHMVILVDLDKEKKVTRVHHFTAYVIHIQPNGDVGFLMQRKVQNETL